MLGSSFMQGKTLLFDRGRRRVGFADSTGTCGLPADQVPKEARAPLVRFIRRAGTTRRLGTAALAQRCPRLCSGWRRTELKGSSGMASDVVESL